MQDVFLKKKKKHASITSSIIIVFTSYFYSFNFFSFSSAKSTHPKKAGGTTKAAAATSTLPAHSAKDARGASRNSAADARTNRKSDTPTSSTLPGNSSTETQSRSEELKSSPVASDTKPASQVQTEETQAASQQGHRSKTVPKASAAGEETSKGTPEPDQFQNDDRKAAEDITITQGQSDSCSKEEKQEKRSGEGGEEDVKKGEDSSDPSETKLRWKKLNPVSLEYNYFINLFYGF